MAIDLLINIPQTSDPVNFASRADNLLGTQLNTYATQANDVALAMNLNSINGTSTTSNVIGLGSKTFTTQTGKSIQPGMYLVIADTAAPSTNNMYVQVTSYVSATGVTVVNVLNPTGSGTKTAWTISFSGGFYAFPDSYVRVHTANSFGTSANSIRRFTTIVGQSGNDITYADSATLGGTFTINTSGTYSVSYNDQFSSAVSLGITINTLTPIASIVTVPVTEILGVSSTPAANFAGCASYNGYLVAGSVLRAHSNGATPGTATTFCEFSIARVN